MADPAPDDWAFGTGGFVKVYGCRLAQSSLLDRDVATRWVFFFMLSQADAQGRYRCASVAGLARAAAVTPEQAERAIRDLEDPDPDSTTKDEQGRRIVRIPGGWQIVSYSKYREFRTRRQVAEAEKKRRKRRRQKGDVSPSSPDMSPSSPDTSPSSPTRGQRADARGQTPDRDTDGTEPVPSRHPSTMASETMAAIEDVARKLADIIPTITAPEWIARCSSIPAGNGRAAKSFTSPRRKGLREEWGKATLARLHEQLANAERPVPL